METALVVLVLAVVVAFAMSSRKPNNFADPSKTAGQFLITKTGETMTPRQYGFLSIGVSLHTIEVFVGQLRGYSPPEPSDNDRSIFNMLLDNHRYYLDLNYVALNSAAYCAHAKFRLLVPDAVMVEVGAGIVDGLRQIRDFEGKGWSALQISYVTQKIAELSKYVLLTPPEGVIDFDGPIACKMVADSLTDPIAEKGDVPGNALLVQKTALAAILTADISAVLNALVSETAIEFVDSNTSLR